jgi:hypothetical protein
MPIQTETSDQTTYCVMFGQRDCDNRLDDSSSDGADEWQVKLVSKKDFKIVSPPILKQKSCAG